MTGPDLSEFSEEAVLKELKNFMFNEKIRPEPEIKLFSKYLATLSNEDFLNDDEILHLIDSHGVQTRNDVKYWLDRSDSVEDSKKQVPVLGPRDFNIKDFNDVMDKLKEMPSEWTIIQITKKFSPADIVRNEDNEMSPVVHISRFTCGDLAERVRPYSVTTEAGNSQSNIFKVLENMSKIRREYYNLGRNNKKLYNAHNSTNTELMTFVKELESYILRQWLCLFHGRLEDPQLERDTLDMVRKLISSYCQDEKLKTPDAKRMDVIYLVALSAHFLKNKTIFSLLCDMLYGGDKDAVNVTKVMLLAEDIKMLNLKNGCALKRAQHYPVILILDDEFETVPWEMITPLCGQQVCRISSFHLLYALYRYHRPHIEKGFRVVEIDCTYCLINPSKDLETCEKKMKEFLKRRMPWAEVDLGKAPEPKVLISKMEDYTAYLYCGHGSGIQYLKARDVKKAFVKGLLLLFGCSSNIPKNSGGRTPPQNNTYTYISNGCPCIIGCIQDLSSNDADVACEEILSNIMPNVVPEGPEKGVAEAKEANVLKALASGKSVCPKYWSKSALVARGIPCKTAIGDATQLTALRFS